MKRSLILLACLCTFSSSSIAQEGSFTSADYLSIADTQQEIYLQRMLNGNKSTYGACTEGMTIQQINQAFTNWVNLNPQYLQNALFTSFTAALIDFCTAKNIRIR